MSIPALVAPWLNRVEDADWVNLKFLGLGGIRFLRRIPLQQTLLHAMVRDTWDPEVHVFRFKGEELCPTVEEFRAYLGSFRSERVIAPRQDGSMTSLFSEFLGMPRALARSLMSGGRLDVGRVVRIYGPGGDAPEGTTHGCRLRALVICLMAGYLLVNPEGNFDPCLVGVAVDFERREDIIPLVLAETLMGLDRVKAGEITSSYAGAPLLLQVRRSSLDFWYRVATCLFSLRGFSCGS